MPVYFIYTNTAGAALAFLAQYGDLRAHAEATQPPCAIEAGIFGAMLGASII